MSASSQPSPGPGAGSPAQERRRAPRHRTLQRCLVWATPTRGVGAWNCLVYDISTIGVGLTLPLPVPTGHTLRIQPFGVPGAPALEARVVRLEPVEFVWFCGCELLRPISEDELRAWLTVSLEWLDADPPPPG